MRFLNALIPSLEISMGEQRSYNILVLGDSDENTTTMHRVRALQRLGHYVEVFDPERFIYNAKKTGFSNAVHYRTGYVLIQKSLIRHVKMFLVNSSRQWDITWVEGGEMIGSDILCLLKRYCKRGIILYNHDDPTGFRDGNRFYTLRKSLPYYDICGFVRQENIVEAFCLGAKNPIWLMRGYDEKIHSSIAVTCKRNEVIFVGTNIRGEGRDIFILKMLANGIKVRIAGNSWMKSRNWVRLEEIFISPAVYNKDYCQLISESAMALGLLSKGNRDLVTTRSFEIPACGGVLCAERTSEHSLLFEDGISAILWADVEECIEKCNQYLECIDATNKIRVKGKKTIEKLGVGNEDTCRTLLSYFEA